tara:strand:- start:457 stop:834 length:378 start_codon:yes stop_codon:yes gene_type:complete
MSLFADQTSGSTLNTEQRMWLLAEELACPVCDGQSIKDSNAELAQQMRALIVVLLDSGRNEKEVTDYLVLRYGEEILLDPPKSGFQLGVWIGPVLFILIGVGIVSSKLFSVRDSMDTSSESGSSE